MRDDIYGCYEILSVDYEIMTLWGYEDMRIYEEITDLVDEKGFWSVYSQDISNWNWNETGSAW